MLNNTMNHTMKDTAKKERTSMKGLFDEWEFESILDSISDAVFIDDSTGHALWCNKAWENIYNVHFADIRGKHVSELEKDGLFRPSVTSIVLSEKRETTIIHENNRGTRLLSTGTPIWDNKGNISKVITTSRDISELSIMENKLISSFEKSNQKDSDDTHGIVASSPEMKNVLSLARRLADVDSTVLLTGESGVGKGMVAEYLYHIGNRKDGPFISVNCGAIPESLIESELFGYEKGAFTGARSEGKKGFFEAADGGTIFLDEIGDLPLPLQVKLLHVIQERLIIRVGGTQKLPVNVRILSATNRDLKKDVQEGRFREDLYYRLNVVPIRIPSLRERPEDIPDLIRLNLRHYNKKYHENKSITASAQKVLAGFNWPGNIRELQNIVERLVLTTGSDEIDADDLPEFILEASENADSIPRGGSLAEQMALAEKKILSKAAQKYDTTRHLAQALQTSQPTIVRKLNKYHIHLHKGTEPASR